MLCAVLAGLGLTRGAAAQVPQANSPAIPTPYQSPLFHAGGSDPALGLTPPFLNPLYGQLQGTPTETVGGSATAPGFPVQIPSFDLGAYNPNLAPGFGGSNVYYPDHLADGGVFSWQAPFNYAPLSVGTVVVDDTSAAPTPASGTTPGTSGFALTGGWVLEPPAGGTASPAAGTATGGEYQRLPPNIPNPATSDSAKAVWTLVATAAGSFSVYFHIPDQIEDASGNVEPRSTQVTYQITTTGANAQTSTATVSQTEANSTQFLAGPFLLAVGDSVTVTLQRDNFHNQNTEVVIAPATTGAYLIADSMTLQTSIGDVRSSPTAINATAYPTDFAQVKYWGIYVPAGTTNPVSATAGVNNALPDTSNTTGTGTPIFRYGDNNKLDAIRLIRQLVYFGRQDPTVSQGTTVDDQNGSPRFTSSAFSSIPDSTGTATNGRYSIAPPVSAGSGPTATWSFIAPNGGDYYATVHLPQTPPTPPNPVQKRIPDAPYTISVNGTPLANQPAGGFKISQAQTGDVTLPTGAIPLNKGDVVTVQLTALTGRPNPTSYTVVADSARLATGGAGAIYCVDGFTGGVVWRFQTPGGLNGPGAPVFSSPAVTKINVLVTPAVGTTPAVYANKLVVIVGDNNGMVYCLDAIGNGDGTSNSNAIDPASGLPIYIPQPAYGATPPIQVDAAGYTPHVGTTGAYWIYRPDPNRPKIVTGTGIGTVRRDARGNALLDPNSDLPVPAAFGAASPNVFIDPLVSTTPNSGALASNAKVYVGNSNGVLYALDALGVSIDGTDIDRTNPVKYEASGDRFNASYDLRRSAADAVVPTPQPLWWFTLRGANPNSTDNTSNADIESAPALYLTRTATTVTGGVGTTPVTTYAYAPTVYIGSAHEMEATSNVGRLYALNGTVGPSGNNGLTDPSAQPDPAQPNYTGPGSLNYNLGQRPQINNGDAADWSFPDAYDRTTNNATKNNKGQSSNKLARPALGNVTGSPVVFTNTNEPDAARRTRLYFAANVGLEVTTGSTTASDRPDDTETGRLWAVNLDGSVGRTTRSTGTASTTVWAYPLANDPNNAALDTTPEPSLPLGSFLHATPAMGFVQFPATITNGDSSTYVHADAVRGDVKTQSIPMLYVGTRGANDTALYAIDVDGGSDDQRLIYRQISPDGSIFQSSPALIANTSKVNGNGGAVYVVAGNTLYDFSATPISNPITGQASPLIRENKAYTGFGPLSSPAVAAADTLNLFAQGTSPYSSSATDWIYVGDSSTGFCRGITPFDTTDLGIPGNLGAIVPPTADPPGTVNLQAIMQVYLVKDVDSGSVSAAAALPLGGALPVYDWGQNVYIRFKNVAPPRDPNGGTDKVVVDPAAPAVNGEVQGYGNGGPIEFDISDTIDGTPPDHGTVPATFLPAATTPLGNGFIARSDTSPGIGASLVDSVTNRGYIGAYTYAISDGTARRNTPGSRRHIINAKQTVSIYTKTGSGNFTRTTRTAVLAVQITNGNAVSTPITDADGKITGYAPNLTPVPPVDQPTFGILNPLAVRGGGIPLQLNPGTTPQEAVEIGDTVGPFRGVTSPIPNTSYDLEALANGNNILLTAPTSTSGGGGTIRTSPVQRNTADTNPPSRRHIVVTSTGLISHNTSGDNSDARPAGSTSLPLFPPMGFGTSGEGLTTLNFGSASAAFAMDMADRSALGLRQKRLRVKTLTASSGGGSGLFWNDNSIPTAGHDHDSVVNFLPWETPPPTGPARNGSVNSSTDYPNISPSNISATLHRHSGGSADLTLGNAIAEPATLDARVTDPIAARQVYANPIQFHIIVPHFQPANQQLYQQITPQPGQPTTYSTGQETAPVLPDGTPNITYPLVFPMGYTTNQRLYVPDQTGARRDGAAYRNVRVYTGVPPDYSTQMTDKTVEVGQVPSGFGIQTSKFAGLTDANGITTFDPYNLDFQDYYKPLTIYNTGNVNLLNVHLDQKQSYNGSPSSLLMTSDAVDTASFIPGYDSKGALTGPRFGRFGANNEPEDSYLIRSQLDGDLVAAYGHNPYIVLDPNNVSHLNVYPGATFHKAQVGSGQPSTLSVPDSPEGFTQGASLDVSPTLKPAIPNYANGPVYKAPPYVSVAIPFGTPVGSYHTSLQLFEGLDSSGYDSGKVVAASAYPAGVPQGDFAGLTAQIFPPQYGKAIGGIGAPTAPGTTPNNRPQDTIEIVQGGRNAQGVSNPPVSLMPNSSIATALNVKVVEDRMTDGFTFGAVPMVDQGLALPAANAAPAQAVPDFAPAAYRDPTSGNLSVYWTSGRVNPGYGIYSATVPVLDGAFMPVDPSAPGTAAAPGYVNQWWTSLGNASTGYNAGALAPAIPTNQGTNSGLTIAQDPTNLSTLRTVGAFTVNVQAPPLPGVPAYQNTLLYYPVTPRTGALGSAVPVTNDPSQVKYGVKGLFTNTAFNSAPNLWAFWTATTRGRTAIYYNSQDPTSKAWVPASGSKTLSTIGLLPIPAGLTAVADPAPLLMFGNVPTATGPQLQATVEVTYSGTAPDGNVDLYQSRYQPDGDPKNPKPFQLDLVPFPAVTEILKATGQPGGWYQTRDVAWSRTSALNLSVEYVKNGGTVTPPAALLYDGVGKPLFSRAVFDKATGLLVLTGVPVPDELPDRTGSRSHTVYVEYATGRVRFSPALRTTDPASTTTAQTYEVRAFFSPLARRITSDSRANTSPITFLDGTAKPNDAFGLNGVLADRRWYIWRKSGVAGAAASIYYKTQRLTAYLSKPVDVTKPISVNLNGTAYSGALDVQNVPAVIDKNGNIKSQSSARIYLPISSGAEGATITGGYTALDTSPGIIGTVPDTVQWQDEIRSNDATAPPTDATTGLTNINPGYLVPLANPVNENNVAAFLDPEAYYNSLTSNPPDLSHPHKVWLFWNSTRNGTADLYYETINPLFTAGP